MAAIFFRQSCNFSDAYRSQLISSILCSDYFGPSVLGKEFINTSGLSLVFRRDHLDTVISHFPVLAPLFEVALFDSSNAFYVNPLVLDETSTVYEHVDCRYIGDTGMRILPTLVSVFYAEVDKNMTGGELVLVTDVEPVRLRPHCNELVHFVGSTRHYVSSIRGPCRRLSIVIEQYNLEGDSLAAFPECHVVREGEGNRGPALN